MRFGEKNHDEYLIDQDFRILILLLVPFLFTTAIQAPL